MTIEALFKKYTFNYEWLEDVLSQYREGEYVGWNEVTTHLFGHTWHKCARDWRHSKYKYNPWDALDDIFQKNGFEYANINSVHDFVWMKTNGKVIEEIDVVPRPFKIAVKYIEEVSKLHEGVITIPTSKLTKLC